MLYITLISHRTEYHGSSCIWPAGSRCQETFMSQWLHWWLSSLYFVVSHKGIARARPFLSPIRSPLSLLRPSLNVKSINSEFKSTHAYPQCMYMYHIQMSSHSSYVSIHIPYMSGYPAGVTPTESQRHNVAMRDPSLHDVVTAASAPWTVPKKVPFRANGPSNHGGNHGENEENEVFSFWILGVFSD